MCFPSYLWPHWSSKPWREAELLSKVFSPWQQGWCPAQLVTGRALLDGALWRLTPRTAASPTRMALRISYKRAGQTSQLMSVACPAETEPFICFVVIHSGSFQPPCKDSSHPAPVCSLLRVTTAHFLLKLGKFKSLLKVPLFTEQVQVSSSPSKCQS